MNILPFQYWLHRYSTSLGRADFTAGLTTAVMLIPQAMAYALLAGLPPYVGLYAAAVGPFLYALYGSSSSLSVGPTATASLLAAGVLNRMQLPLEQLLPAAALLAIGVGAVQVAMGVLSFGSIARFLPYPVMGGFVSAAALIIGVNQLDLILGLELPRSSKVHLIVWSALKSLPQCNLWSVLLSLPSIVMLVLFKRLSARFPRALFVVVLGALIVWLFELPVACIGELPKGLPTPQFPTQSLELWIDLVLGALTIALVAFIEVVSIGERLRKIDDPPLKPNRELVAMGVSNMGAGLFQGYPVAAGFSRSAVNNGAGARTPLAGVVTSCVIVLVLVFLSGLIGSIPKAVLGAIIVTAVLRLIDLKEPIFLWKHARIELWIFGTSFIGTLFMGLQQGLIGGAGVAALLMLRYRQMPLELECSVPNTIAVRGPVHYLNMHRITELLPKISAKDVFVQGLDQVDSTAYKELLKRQETFDRQNRKLHLEGDFLAKAASQKHPQKSQSKTQK
ncbi:MAG: sodium-independent anion transporter [Proteobacteria bacterium]|nr:sodium-independent anion transporter [Pseudomonadota bacterium]